jgi:hypothetical protein
VTKEKKNPAIAVWNFTDELMQHLGRAGLLSTSIEGVSAATAAVVP